MSHGAVQRTSDRAGLETSGDSVKDIYRYGTDINSHDLLKILAISTMVIDHIGRFLFVDNVWWRVVGRMAAPQFFFLVGYSGSYRFKREILFYGAALVLVSFLTDTSPGLASKILPVNILISFVIIKAVLNRFDPGTVPTVSLIALLALLMLASLPAYYAIEYGTFGFCYAMGARLLRQHHGLGRFWVCTTVVAHFFFELVYVLILNPVVSIGALPFTIGVLVVVFGANLTMFLNYEFRVFNVRPKRLRTVALYISRYSLQIYFFHLAAFMIFDYT